MTDKHHIMIIDDSLEDCAVLESILEDDFQLTLFNNPKDALNALEGGLHPNLILLDIEMPEIDGYEACTKIHSNDALSQIDVIFLSAHNTTEDIIRGLDAGAIDYFTKPYDSKVLVSKINKAIAYQANKTNLKQQVNAANQLIQTVMSESGNLGNIVNFLRSSFTVYSPTELMDTLLDTLKSSGLSAIVYFQSASVEQVESTSGEANELESELVLRFHGHTTPFIEKGARLFVIQKHIVLFIKNMPTDADKRGSLKDNIMILLEGANSKLEYFDQRAATSSQQAQLVSEAVISALQELDEIQNKEQEHKKESLTILESMVADVEASIFSMGLTEEQEAELIDILQKAIINSNTHLHNGMELDEQVKQAVLTLSNVVKQTTH